MAALRNLGDSVPKMPEDMSGDTTIGTLALQDADKVAITGGSISGIPGLGVPIGSIIPWYGTLTDAGSLLSQGFAVCDGRKVRIPGTTTDVTMPDLTGVYPRFSSSTVAPKSTGGGFDYTVAGVAGPTVTATVPDNPDDAGEHGYRSTGYSNTPSGGSISRIIFIDRILGQTFAIPAIPARTITVVPPYASLIPLQRIF